MIKISSSTKVIKDNIHDEMVIAYRENLINIGVYDKVKNQDFDEYIVLKGVRRIKGLLEIIKEALDYDNISGSGGKITIYKNC